MIQILVRHEVQDFKKWKSVFDSYAALRKKHGSEGGQVLTSVNNPNEVVVLLKWDSLENWEKFTSSHDMKESMKQGGVVGKPDAYVLEESYKPSA